VSSFDGTPVRSRANIDIPSFLRGRFSVVILSESQSSELVPILKRCGEHLDSSRSDM
jgi:hypothetical protein